MVNFFQHITVVKKRREEMVMKKTKDKKYKKIKKQVKKLAINTAMTAVIQQVIKLVFQMIEHIFFGLLSILGGVVSPQQPTYQQPSAQTVYEQTVQVTTIDEVDQLIICFH